MRVHFEQADMAQAKQELAGVACVAGNYRYQTLHSASEAAVIEEAKRLLDACAPGGGYLFDFDGGLYDLPEGRLELLFNYLREHGRY